MLRSLRDDEPVPDATPRRYVAPNGYVALRWTIAPREEVEAWEHRIVMGRPKGKAVHHKNGVRHDNRLENLEICTSSEHGVHHRKHDWDEVVRLYQSGMSQPEVAECVGADAGQVSRILKRMGVPARSLSEALTKHHIDDQVLDMHARGWTQRQMIEVLGVSRSVLTDRYRRLGLNGKCGPKRRPVVA